MTIFSNAIVILMLVNSGGTQMKHACLVLVDKEPGFDATEKVWCFDVGEWNISLQYTVMVNVG